MGAFQRDISGSVAVDPFWQDSGAARADGLLGLPVVPKQLLRPLFARMTPEEARRCARCGLLPVAWVPNQVFYALHAGRPRPEGVRIVAHIKAADFDEAVRLYLAPQLGRAAAFGLRGSAPVFSAHVRVTDDQRACLLAGAMLLFLVLAYAPGALIGHVLGLGFSALFGIMVWLRAAALFARSRQKLDDPEWDDDKLPVYSILVPAFRETAVLPQLIGGLCRLNYPPEKLEIKLILEETDTAMLRHVATLALPRHFEVLVVPAGKPQTKPRALNYALNFARGTLLTIYDAEDIPEPLQLRQAVRKFSRLAETYACLQAELAFYNPNENWLTRQFTIEYATLFCLILPSLAAHGMPLPLGGTSNHFKTEALQAIGGWDAYNVTEDADLGFRMARLGYQTATLFSTTYEEANTSLPNWLNQRARWYKGFLQTWLVHMRRPLALYSEIGGAGVVTLHAMILGVVVSAALYPFFLVTTLWQLIDLMTQEPDAASGFAGLATCFYLVLFVTGLGVMMASGAVALRRKRIHGWWMVVASMPVYWLLGSIAALMALWQLLRKPFHWNKTHHGLSGFVHAPAADPPPQVATHRPRRQTILRAAAE